MTRAFVAVRPPAAVLDAIDARTARVDLPAGARRTPRAQWHITVQFLGDHVDLDAVAAELTHVRAAVGDDAPRSVRLGGATTLPPRPRAKFLVLGVAHGGDWLAHVADAVASAVAPLGIVREERAFTPHLTIARFRDPVDLAPAVAAIGPDPVGDAWPAGELVLYESRLGSGPAEHVERAAVPLGA